MVKSCSAYRCVERGKKGVVFHRFPKDLELRKKWLVAMKRQNFVPKEHSRICGKHFLESDYCFIFGQKRLKDGVVPTVFDFKKTVNLRNSEERTQLKSEEFAEQKAVSAVTVTPDVTTIPSTSNSEDRTQSKSEDFAEQKTVSAVTVSPDVTTIPSTSLVISAPKDPKDASSNVCISKKIKKYNREPVYFGDFDRNKLKTEEAKKVWDVANRRINKYKITINNLRVRLHRLLKKTNRSQHPECNIKGARPPIVDNSDTSDTEPEKIEDIFIKEEYMEETPLDTQHIDKTSLNPSAFLETIIDEPQNQLHKDINADNIEEIFIKEEPIEETPQCKEFSTILKKEYVNNSQNIQLNSDTNADNIEEIFIKEEQMEEIPQDKELYNNILKKEYISDSMRDIDFVNPSAFLETIIEEPQKTNADIEQIFFKEEPIEETPPDRELYNNIKEEDESDSENDDTDSQPEHNTEDEEENWEEEETNTKTITHETKNQDHKNKIQKQKEHRCNICTELFKCKDLLVRHLQHSHTIKDLSCTICKKMFTHVYDLNKHMDLHNAIKNFTCSICKKIILNYNNLQQHIKLHTEQKEIHAENQINDPFSCPICVKKLNNKNALNRHMKIHSSKKLQCEDCEKIFTRKDNLIHHKKHSCVGPRSENNVLYSCSVCPKKLKTSKLLNNHMKIHFGVKEYQCDVCEKFFMRKDSLRQHMRSHSDEKEFQCEICNKSFTHKSILTYHLKTHTGEKEFQCGVCQKSFRLKATLTRHMIVHYDVKELVK